jgi:hypothetical protein
LEKVEDGQKRLITLNKTLNDQFTRANQILNEQTKYKKELLQLQKQGADDPISKVFDSYEVKKEQYKKDFSNLGPEKLGELNKAADVAQQAEVARAVRDMGIKYRQASASLSQTDNPIIKFIDEAQVRVDKFGKDFQVLGEKAVGSLRSMSDQLRDSNILKFDLSERLGLGKLKTEMQKLESFGLFNNQRQDDEAARVRLAEARLREAYDRGDVEGARLAQAALVSRETELREKEKTLYDQREYVKAAETQNERLAYTKTEDRRRFAEKAVDDELNILKSRLAIQGLSPDSQRLILDKIIDATGRVEDLNYQQREDRLKALQQRIALGEGEKHRVLIEIKNSSDLASARVEQILGDEPTPQTGSTVAPSRIGGAFGNAI